MSLAGAAGSPRAAAEAGGTGLVDTRTVGKLEGVTGKPEHWTDWSFKARAWFGPLDANGEVEAMMSTAESSGTSLDFSTTNAAAQRSGRIVYNMLAQVCAGRAFAVIKQVQRGNGFESWRRLVREYEPQVGARFASMLTGILNPDWGKLTLVEFADALYDWETGLTRYEDQSGEQVGSSMRVAIVLSRAPESVREILRSQLAVIDNDFDKLKRVVHQLTMGEKSFTSTGVAASSSSTATAMDIDAIKGNCYKCGKPGHMASECRSGLKGKPKGKNPSSGKGVKGKFGKMGDSGGKPRVEAGKGLAAPFHGQCGRCKAYGHKRADCPLKPRGTASVESASSVPPAPLPVGITAAIGYDVGTESEEDIVYGDDDVGWVMMIASGAASSSDAPAVCGSILLDSGSDEHVCPESWHEEADLAFDTSGIVLRDVQGQEIPQAGKRQLKMDFAGADGRKARATSEFLVSQGVREPVLSAGRIIKSGGVVHLEGDKSYMELGGRRVEVTMKGNRFHVRPQRVIAAAKASPSPESVTPSRKSPSSSEVATPESSSSPLNLAPISSDSSGQGSGDAEGEQPRGEAAEAGEVAVEGAADGEARQAVEEHVPKLYAWSYVKDLKARLAELGAPMYGDKDTLWARLVKAKAQRKRDLEVARAVEIQRQRGEELDPDAAPEPRHLPGPQESSKGGRERRCLTHVPAAPWCVHCLRGKSQAKPHARVHWLDRGQGPPLVCIDFMYLKSDLTTTDDVAEAWATTLVAADESTGMTLAVTLDSKMASNEYLHETLVTFLDRVLRHRQLILQHDGEPAITVVAKFVQVRRKEDTQTRSTPRYSSGSNGLVEVKIKAIQGPCRTMKLSVEERYKLTIDADHISWPWLVRHSTWVLNRFQPGPSGRTAFMQLNAAQYRGELVVFGELSRYSTMVLYRESYPADRRLPGGARKHKADPAWHKGIWWGRAENSDEHILGTANGVVKSRSARRLPPSERNDIKLLESCRGVPWDPRQGLSLKKLPRALRPGVEPPRALGLHDQITGRVPRTPRSGTATPGTPGRAAPTTPRPTAGASSSRAEASPAQAAAGGSAAGMAEEAASSGQGGQSMELEEQPRNVDKRALAVQGDVDGGGDSSPKRVRTVGALAVVDEELSMGETLKNRDVSTMDPEKVTAAKDKELGKLASFGAYAAVDGEVALKEMKLAGGKKITTRWEVHEVDGLVKARFVCREFATTASYDFFAPATSYAATGRMVDIYALEENLWTFTFDAHGTFPHVPEQEYVLCDPPAEWQENEREAGRDPTGKLWRMMRTLYGRRPAAKCWTERLATDLVERCGLERCEAVPTFFKAMIGRLRREVHMDDGHGAGTKQECNAFLEKLGENVLVEKAGPHGPGSSCVFLGRERIRERDYTVIKPGVKHINGLLKLLGLEHCKPVRTPTLETTALEPGGLEPLQGEEASLYKQALGIALYLAMDRPDVLYAVKELGRWSAQPLMVNMRAMRRMGRYLVGTSDYVMVLRRTGIRDIVVTTDANWAGCRKTRKSTSCLVVQMGDNTLCAAARTQTALAMSSGESEYYAAVSGAAEAIFLAKIWNFLGWTVGVTLKTDSSAARGTASRLGAGRMRTLELQTLWLQKAVALKKIVIESVKSAKNVADIGTKPLASARLLLLSGMAGLRRWVRGEGLRDL